MIMKPNNFRNIESFEDFENEKVRLYYELKLTEKKLLIKKMEISEALSPANILTTIFTEISKPLLRQFGELIKNLFSRNKKSNEDKEQPEKES